MANDKSDMYENLWNEETFSEPISQQTSTDPSVDNFPMDSAQPMTMLPGYTGSDVPEQKKEKASVSSKYSTQATTFEDVYKSSIFPDNFLIINDVILSDIPTTAVKFISSDGVFIAETLRTSAPIVTPNNAQSLSVQLSLIFDSTQESMTKLRRLVSVLSVHPLVFIYNNKIRKNLGVKHDENTIFILEHGTLRSSPDAVGCILMDLSLHYFNYKPFSNHFWYNASMPDGKTNSDRLNDAVALPFNNQSLGDLTGYEASDHSIQQEAEDLIREMKIGTYKLGEGSDKLSQNQPVPFPAASDTWMYFANHLFSKANTLSEIPSDYIGFEMREYSQISPPKGAQAGGGNPRELINKEGFPPVSKFYDAHDESVKSVLSKTASQRKAEAYSDDAGYDSKTSYTPIEAEASGQAWVSIYNSLFTNGEDTWKTKKALDTSINLSAHLADEKGWTYDYKGASKCNLLFYETLYRAGYKVPLIDRRRGKGYPDIYGSIRMIKNGTSPMIRMTGRTKGEIQRLIDSGVPVGVFWNGPNAHVVNATDLRRIKYNGDVITEITVKGLDQHGHNIHVRKLKHLKDSNKDIGIDSIEIAAAIPIGKTAPVPEPFFPAPVSDPTRPKEPSPEDLQSMIDTFDVYVEKAERDTNGQYYLPRQLDARTEWIRQMESKQDLTYYWGDNKLRNIFYRTISTDVLSDPTSQRSGIGLKNIVCSSLSLNFGHRIVPQRLVGQDTCTWQFLGAGNKSGTLIFSFAGEDGRKSADEIKSMFHRARANAKLYGTIIPDAGSIKVNRVDPTNKINNLLSLMNVNNVVVSEISETSVSGSTDKYELVVNFIAQEFAKEGLERRFVSSIDTKKRMIASLLKLIKAETLNNKAIKEASGVQYTWNTSDFGKIRDNVHIRPDPSIIESTSAPGKPTPYGQQEFRVKQSNFPAWLAELIVDTARICNKLNSEMPPSGWRVNKGLTRTWADRYAEFGAENIMKGQVINIEPTERNEYVDQIAVYSPYDTNVYNLDDIQKKNSDMYEGRFDHNGGKHTNRTHDGVYTRFLDQMNIMIDRARKYMMADKANFDKYFGSVSDEIMDSIIASIGDCYQDMDLPLIPGGQLPLPPEFYVFNDADEDPALSSLTDDYNMEAFLLKHIANERASIKHYLKDAYLGGSYLSQNMPKILRERADYMSQFEAAQSSQTGTIGEFDFFHPKTMLAEGVKTWEPLYYNENELKHSGDTLSDALAWKGRVDEKYNDSLFASSKDKIRTKYMDNIVSLSPYLKHGRGELWSRGEDSSDNVAIIESVYDENWKRIAFGPNPDHANTDEKMSGHMAPPSVKRNRDLQKMTLAQVKSKAENKEILVRGAEGTVRTVLPDGSVMIGSTEKIEAEAGNRRWEDAAKASDPKSMAKEWDAKKEEYVKKWMIKEGKTRETMSNVDWTGVAAAWEQNKYSFKTYESKADANDFGNIAATLTSHDGLASKFKDGDEDKDLAKMVKGIAFGTKAQDLSIRRAYPTFKIYFIEEDSHETEKVDGNVMRAFDDFYSYSSIQEIKVTRSRKTAGDLAVIRMTNVGGKLLRKRYGDKDPVSIAGETALRYGVGAEYATGFFADTKKENPFEKMIMQDGVKTQIRLGYANDPDLLESCFLGQIVEISPRENGRIIEIVCQGYGSELESVELGPLEDGPTFYSTQQVLSAAIIQDSIVNFGRRSKFNKFNISESRHAFTGGLGKGLTSQTIDALIHTWGDDNQYKQFYKHQFLNYPQDDNIYAPPPQVYATTWMRFFNNACIYRPLSQTPWEIFKEHELRHPGYVSLAVPYGHSPRMTMYFGSKGQHYWSKAPSQKEIFLSETLADNVVAGRGITASALRQNPFLANQMQELAKSNASIAKAVLVDLAHYGAPVSVGKAVGELFGRYVPFRNYHYFDAAHHILKNEIKTSKDGVFNEVEVLFFENENDITNGDSEELAENVEKLVRKESGRLACKLDDNLPPEHIRSLTEEFPSCVTSDMAKRYIQGLFARHLRDAYKGELIVLGEAKLKPYDVCYLNDTSINMTGPIEVEAVTHIFNRDHGFISIITPDLCVDINDYYSATVLDVVGAAYASMNLGALNTVPIVGSLASDISFLGLYASVKYMQWSQDGVPVISTPLTLGGKPFQSVAMGLKNASLFYTWGGRWNQHWDDVQSGWEKFDLSETLMDTSRSWQESINTFMSSGKGAGHSLEKS